MLHTHQMSKQLPGNLVEMSLQYNNSLFTMHVWSLAYSISRDNLPLAFSTLFLHSKKHGSSLLTSYRSCSQMQLLLTIWTYSPSWIRNLYLTVWKLSSLIHTSLNQLMLIPVLACRMVQMESPMLVSCCLQDLSYAAFISSFRMGFFVPNASFNEQQHHSLQDYVETSIMLQYYNEQQWVYRPLDYRIVEYKAWPWQ